MGKPIPIYKGTTCVRIGIDSNNPAALYLKGLANRVLTDTEFDPRRKRMIPTKRYAKYDSKNQVLYLPVNLTQDVVDMFIDLGYDYELIEEPWYNMRPLTVRMKDSFTPRPHQIPAIEYLRKIKPYRKGLAIQTGSGKTVSSIAGAIAYGRPFMIVVSRLHHQWVESVLQFTNVKPNQIAVIQGFDSLFKVMESENKPEIFVWSLETLRAYCHHEGHYAELPTFAKFCEYFGIGTKIMDEVHLNFHADTLIDLSCNIPNNIYLTATFTSGSKSTRKIFNIIYPPEMRFGEGVTKKYTAAYCYGYRGDVPEKKCTSQRGYMHIKYEKYLLKRPTLLKAYFDRVLSPLVYSHYINKKNPGEKLAVFFAMLEMVDYAYEWFKKEFPDMKVTKYIGGVDDDVLKTNEIIVTTPKSMSVGTDVKQLRTVINTVSTKSPTAVLQICGRLREIPGVTTEFVDICDMNILAHKYHQRDREAILRPTVISYSKYMLP